MSKLPAGKGGKFAALKAALAKSKGAAKSDSKPNPFSK